MSRSGTDAREHSTTQSPSDGALKGTTPRINIRRHRRTPAARPLASDIGHRKSRNANNVGDEDVPAGGDALHARALPGRPIAGFRDVTRPGDRRRRRGPPSRTAGVSPRHALAERDAEPPRVAGVDARHRNHTRTWRSGRVHAPRRRAPHRRRAGTPRRSRARATGRTGLVAVRRHEEQVADLVERRVTPTRPRTREARSERCERRTLISLESCA